MTDYVWSASGAGDWNTNANWTPGTGFPVAGDTATFNTTSAQNCTLDSDVACGDITFAGYTGTFNSAGYNYDLTGDVSLDSSVTWTKGAGLITLSGTATQTIDFDGNAVEDIEVDKTADDDIVQLTGAVTSDNITLTKGTLDLNDQTWTTSVSGGVGLSAAAGTYIKDTSVGKGGDFSLAGTIDLNGSANIITNSEFTTDFTGWVNETSHWSVVSGRAYHPSSLDFEQLRQDVTVTSADVYLVSFDYDVVAGRLRVDWRTSSDTFISFIVDNITGTGSFSEYVTVPTSSSKISFAREAGYTSEFYIDNVSISRPVTWTDVDITGLASGANDASYTTVSGSNNSSGNAIDATDNCTDSGSNTGWTFSGGAGPTVIPPSLHNIDNQFAAITAHRLNGVLQ